MNNLREVATFLSLASPTPAQVADFLSRVSLAEVFALLWDASHGVEAREVLRRICASESGPSMLMQASLQPVLKQALQRQDDITAFCVTLLKNMLRTVPSRNRLLDSGLFMAVVELFSSERSFSTSQGEFFKEAAGHSDSLHYFFDSACLSRLQQLMDGDSTIMVRVLGVCIDMGHQSEEAFSRVVSSGVLSRIQPDDDVLLQLSLMELLSQCAKSEPGVLWLHSSGALRSFCRYLNPQHDYFSFLCPGALECVATVARAMIAGRWRWSWKGDNHADTEEGSMERSLCFDVSREMLCGLMEVDDANVLDGVVTACTSIAACPHSMSGLFDELKRVVTFLHSPSHRLQASALYGLELLFCQSRESEEDRRQELLFLIGTSARPSRSVMLVLHDLCQSPMENVSLAAFSLLRATAKNDWGVRAICGTGSLLDVLLSRQQQRLSHDAMQLKYEVLQTMASHSDATLSGFLSHTRIVTLRQYVKQGAFFKAVPTLPDTDTAAESTGAPPAPEVATEFAM